MTEKQELKLILWIIAITVIGLIIMGIIVYDPDYKKPHPFSYESDYSYESDDEGSLMCCCCGMVFLMIPIAALMLSDEIKKHFFR